MKFVGLDMSLAKAGYAYGSIDAQGALLVGEAAKITPPTGMDGVRRLDWWDVWLRTHLDDADLVVIEGYAFSKVQRASQIGEAGGIARLAMYRMGLLTYVVSPAQMKQWISGSGNTNKAGISLAVFKTLGIETSDEDEADALGLLHMAAALYAVQHVPEYSVTQSRMALLVKILENSRMPCVRRRERSVQ